jgi:hypothetical protein
MDLDDELRRRRKQKQAHRRMQVIVGCAVAAILIVGAIALGIRAKMNKGGGSRDSGDPFAPIQNSESGTWTHAEVHAYLQKKGVQCWMHPDGDLSVIFIFAKSYEEASTILDIYRNRRINHSQVIKCEKVNSPEYARDVAGTDPSYKFAWGRFLFEALVGLDGSNGKQYLSAIRNAFK